MARGACSRPCRRQGGGLPHPPREGATIPWHAPYAQCPPPPPSARQRGGPEGGRGCGHCPPIRGAGTGRHKRRGKRCGPPKIHSPGAGRDPPLGPPGGRVPGPPGPCVPSGPGSFSGPRVATAREGQLTPGIHGGQRPLPSHVEPAQRPRPAGLIPPQHPPTATGAGSLHRQVAPHHRHATPGGGPAIMLQ